MSAGTGAFIRTAIQNELNGRPELTKTEALIMEGLKACPVTISALSGASRRSTLCWILLQNSSYVPAGAIDRRGAPGRRPSQGPVPPTDQGCRSKHVRRCPRRPERSGDTWHELTTSGKSGCGHQSVVARRTNALHGLADSSCSCTTPAPREKPATAAPPAEKRRAHVRTCSVAPSGCESSNQLYWLFNMRN
jgi:hypothetical protein